MRGTRIADGATRLGTIVERLLTTAKNTFRIRYDDALVEELVLPDDDVELLPKDEGAFDEGSRLSLEEQRKAWKEDAAAAEEQAREDLAIEGFALHTSSKTDTGYRCVSSIFFARLGVTAFDVRATKDGSVVHIGRFKSKLQAAVAYARFMMSAPSSDSFGNMVVEPQLPESTKEEGINTIDKILDARVVTVDCLEL